LRMLASDPESGGPVGECGLLGLTETLRRSSLLPAQLLEDHVPAMRRKGRLQAGCDADIVIFDPAAVADRASYADSMAVSAGITHVLVNGTLVVRDSHLVTTALPGQPVRAQPR
jgi:N-acyl-D-aspartate/D-glutamate deacylase